MSLPSASVISVISIIVVVVFIQSCGHNYGVMASSTNELLSFVTFYHGKVTYSELLTTISGFYDDGEVSDAKELLFTVVNDLQVDGVPRMKLRNKGVNKRRLDCEDSLSLLEFTDKKLLPLPPFCARNLDRIPRFSPSSSSSLVY